MPNVEERIALMLGQKDIQIAQLLAQIDELKAKVPPEKPKEASKS